jgi:hypothetical protein
MLTSVSQNSGLLVCNSFAFMLLLVLIIRSLEVRDLRWVSHSKCKLRYVSKAL